jgi:hypothetical protein
MSNKTGRHPRPLQQEESADLNHQLYHALHANHELVEIVVEGLCEAGVNILADFARVGVMVHDGVHDPDADHEASQRLSDQISALLKGQDGGTIADALYTIIGGVAALAREAEAEATAADTEDPGRVN